MGRRVIARDDWVNYLDAFSRQHDGWLISVAVQQGSARPRRVTHDVALHGVVAELDDDISSLMVFMGDTLPHATHFVGHATRLEVDETSDGAAAALTISDESGERTIVELRAPLPPERIDNVY